MNCLMGNLEAALPPNMTKVLQAKIDDMENCSL